MSHEGSVRRVVVTKIKRPGGAGTFDAVALDEDRFGTWLYSPIGSAWTMPHDRGVLPVDVLMLLGEGRPWVASWVDDPADPRIQIDVCLPPSRGAEGWSFIDLELDPVRHERGQIELEDQDEFDDACRDGWISADEAAMATAVANEMLAALGERSPPWGDDGWAKLAQARRPR